MIHVRDMALTWRDFLRGLDVAMGGLAYERRERVVSVGDGPKNLRISINPLPPRILGGLMKIERSEVTLSFSGYSPAEEEAFLAQFDRAYHRGGG